MEINIAQWSLQLPDHYQPLDALPDDPAGALVAGDQADESEAMVMVYPADVDAWSMPFDADAVRSGIRSSLAANGSGLVEADLLHTASGKHAIYTVVKNPMEPSGVQYTLTLHAEVPERVQVQAFFSERGMTGMRDAMVAELKQRDGSVTIGDSGLEGWWRDPYDEEASGYLMNLSELPEYDEMFPAHPLAQCRAVLDAIRNS